MLVLRTTTDSLVQLKDRDDRAIVLGFLAGTIGLLVHAIGSNTVIITRIMETFWFFMPIVVGLPMLEEREPAPARAPARPTTFVPQPARRYST